MTLDAELLRETERQRVRSLVQGDLAGADSLHASDYQLITPLGYALSKDDYLGSIESGELDYLVFEPVTEIEVWGDDGIGLLRYQARIEFAGPDRAGPDPVLAHRLLRVARWSMAGRLVPGHHDHRRRLTGSRALAGARYGVGPCRSRRFPSPPSRAPRWPSLLPVRGSATGPVARAR